MYRTIKNPILLNARLSECGGMKKPAAPNMFLSIYLKYGNIKDPIKNYEQYLLNQEILTEEQVTIIKKEYQRIY